MATRVDGGQGAHTPRGGFMADQGFFLRYSIVLAIFILFGFAQFAARGYSSFTTAPAIVHLHGGLMMTWLTIFVTQNALVHKGELAIHRKLGWFSAALVVLISATMMMTGYHAVDIGRQPPFFSPPYFLALTFVGAVAFAGMIGWAISLRRQVQWHRRIMLGSIFILLEPALGRILPMPLIMPWGEWLALAIQLIFVWVLARHDRKILGAVHSATKAVAAILILSHIAFEALAMFPPLIRFAEALAAH